MTARGKSLIIMLLTSIVGVTLLAVTARAEDCLAAPNSPAREGTRWYYRLDRASQRKCWYMRASDQPAQQTTLRKVAPSASRFAIPIPRPRPLAAGSALSLSRGDTGPSSSHAEEITAKPRATPLVSGSTGEITSSIPKDSAPQLGRTSLAAPAPNTTVLIGATDETTSAISGLHQAVPPPEINAAASAPDADAAKTDETSSPASDTAASQQTATLSEPNIQAIATESNAAPQIIAPLDDPVSLIPKDSATQLSTSSDLRSNEMAEPATDISLVEHHAPPAVATVNARPISPEAPPDLSSDGRERTAPTDEPIDNAWTRVKPFYLIVVFLLALVIMSYYVIFRYFLWGSAQMSDAHPDDDGVDDRYNNLGFYRKLRQGAVLEKP